MASRGDSQRIKAEDLARLWRFEIEPRSMRSRNIWGTAMFARPTAYVGTDHNLEREIDAAVLDSSARRGADAHRSDARRPDGR